MSASEEMVRERLDRIIARIESHLEQRCAYANVLTRYGNEATKARGGIALTLSSLKKLQMLRIEFDEPLPRLTCRPQASSSAG